MRYLLFFLVNFGGNVDTLHRVDLNLPKINISGDYDFVYSRIRRTNIRITKKSMLEGNDWRFRVRVSDRVRMFGDIVSSDLNPDNFNYGIGVGWRF